MYLDDSDDSRIDENFILDCEFKRCNQNGEKFCGCGFWLCNRHYFGEICTVHDNADSHSEGLSKIIRKKDNSKDSKAIDHEEHIQQHCEFIGCIGEVWAACHMCTALLCWSHFEEYVGCDKHKLCTNYFNNNNNDNTMTTENFERKTKPENFIVEGGEPEVPVKKKESRNAYLKEVKKRKLAGKDYTIFNTMNLVPPKLLKPACSSDYCKKFGKKCHLFTKDQRLEIMTDFYSLKSLDLQRQYLCSLIEISFPKTQKTNSRKGKRKDFFLPYFGEKLPVCKVLFLNTLSISEKVMRTSMEKKKPSGAVEKEGRGGRSETMKKRDNRIKTEIVQHINRFPRVESHYCREKSSKEYLSSQLSITKMYDMYLQEHEDKDPASFNTYRRVFKSLNVSVHKPKKDQCTLCNTYHSADEITKSNMKQTYEKHQDEKKKVREIKDKSKQKAIENKNHISAVFDLQQVIQLPITQESALFYKQRLSFYNFTIYELANKDCYCYTWDQTKSKRGAAEISSCIFRFLLICDEKGAESVDLFSDGCFGQNKNSVLPAMFLFFLKTSKNVKTIVHYFFEVCHGQSEGDSAHSSISRAIKAAGDLFVPSQIIPIIKLARKKHPYIVTEMNYDDFLNFKKLSQDLRILSLRRAQNDETDVNWTKMLSVMVTKSHINKLFFKTSHFADNFSSIELPRKVDLFKVTVDKLNNGLQKVPEKKINSLVSLCQGVNPVIRVREYQEYYRNLPH